MDWQAGGESASVAASRVLVESLTDLGIVHKREELAQRLDVWSASEERQALWEELALPPSDAVVARSISRLNPRQVKADDVDDVLLVRGVAKHPAIANIGQTIRFDRRCANQSKVESPKAAATVYSNRNRQGRPVRDWQAEKARLCVKK